MFRAVSESISTFSTRYSAHIAIIIASFGIGYILGNLKDGDDSAIKVPNVTEPDDGDLSAGKAGLLEPCKLVLVVRTNAGLSDGRIYELCGDATLSCYKALSVHNATLLKHWERTGQAKIALRGKSEAQLKELESSAKRLNLCARSVSFGENAPTKGVLGIGPAPVELINQVTGKLRLY